MQVQTTFRNLEATEALKSYVQNKVDHVVSKYLDKVTEAHCVLSLERYLHHADVNIHAGHFFIRGRERSEDMYASIDLAMDKIERQLKRYKEKLKSHKPSRDGASSIKVRYDVFSTKPELENEKPHILRSEEFLAKPMTIEEAVMQMDLMNNDFIVFTNGASRDINIVYRRSDGNYGLIDGRGEKTVELEKSA